MRSQCDGGGGISRSIEDMVILELVGKEGKRPIRGVAPPEPEASEHKPEVEASGSAVASSVSVFKIRIA